MSLINFGKGPSKKPVARADVPVEAAQLASQPRALVDTAKQQRAKLARIAESNWLDLEAQLEQALAQVRMAQACRDRRIRERAAARP